MAAALCAVLAQMNRIHWSGKRTARRSPPFLNGKEAVPVASCRRGPLNHKNIIFWFDELGELFPVGLSGDR
jgi:hypothetical protein